MTLGDINLNKTVVQCTRTRTFCNKTFGYLNGCVNVVVGCLLESKRISLTTKAPLRRGFSSYRAAIFFWKKFLDNHPPQNGDIIDYDTFVHGRWSQIRTALSLLAASCCVGP